MYNKYDITKNLIPGLPTNAYRNGVGAYEGVVAHCTDSGNGSGSDTPTGERNYESTTFNNAFVHFFVGVEKGVPIVEQVAPVEYMAWGAGPKANPRFVHVELCMYNDPATFKLAYDAYVWILARLLFDRKLDVSPAKSDGTGTLWAHKDVSSILGGSNHEDPIDYLNTHGIAWTQHVSNVKACYDAMANESSKPVYAVYQYTNHLKDFVSYNDAMAYAKMWDHSHVEEIATKAWKWDNYPIYRLRKTWADASSQLGAYKQLDNAKADADKNPGYTVFDESGNAVYTKPVDVPKPTPQPVAPAPVTPATPKHAIIGTSKVTPDVLAAFVSTNNTKFDKLISEYYSAIGTTYGIQSDVAFCQAIVETHYFLFDMGTAVKPEQHNYAGLGVTQKGEMGLSFDTIENGVRAHLQHLYAYATNSDLPNGETLLDPRFKYVERGIAPSWEDLSTRWATDGAYGDTILKVYDQLLTFSQNYTQNVEKTDAQKGVIFPLSDNSASNTLPENGIEKLDSAQKQGIFNSIVTSLKKLFGI